jgi:uncharacterized protein (DUF885 family)
MISRTVLVIVPLLAVLALVLPTRAEENDDSRLATFFKDFLEAEFRERPLEATLLGDHRFDDQLDDVSAARQAAWLARYRKARVDLTRVVDRTKLSKSGQVDYDILAHHLTRLVWLSEHSNPYETDPRVYNAYISDSIYLLLAQSTLPRDKALASALGRMVHIPKIIAAARINLKNPPAVYVDTALRQNRGSISFYKTGLVEMAGDSPLRQRIKEEADRIVPVLEEYQTFLEKDLLPRAKGEWRVGKEFFARKLELELDAGLTADQVLTDAEAEFTRVEREMVVVARQLWFTAYPGRPLPPDDEVGRRQLVSLVLAHFNREHGQPEDLVRDARQTVVGIKAFIKANDILRLPQPDRCQVLEMPEFQRGNSVAFLNQAPPLDRDAASVYAISPPPRDWDARRVTSFLEEYNTRMIQMLTIHEAYPGHYVQLEYSNRHPSLIRRVLFSGVFAEGWAVYTEQMMLDQGYGKGDLVLRLNQLKWYLRAVANAILDHKMHCTDLTDEQALKFLTERAYQSEGEAVGKIIRAKQSSCQLSTYFVGRMAFYRLRQQIQREQGDAFQLGRFHEAVLDHGTLPVKYLPDLVRDRLQRPR